MLRAQQLRCALNADRANVRVIAMIDELGNYRILKKLGEGGMGIVYKAFDTSLDRLVAVKVLNAEYCGNAEAVERFRTEARAQANLNHTNIATLHAFRV